MDVLDLIDQLDDLIYQAKPALLSGQARVDREEVYALLDQIRIAFPEEIKQAEWIVKERQELQREKGAGGGLRAAVEGEARPVPPPLTPAAAERVCAVIEEGERLRADAEREAGEIEAEARRRADAMVTDAEAKLRRADDVAEALMREATSASAEIDGALDRVRGPAAALGDVLGECASTLAARLERIRVAASQPTEEWSYPGAVSPDTPAEGPPDHPLPGPDSYVHAERLPDEERSGERAPG